MIGGGMAPSTARSKYVNKAQAKTVEALRAALVRHKSNGEPEKHEFKTFEVSNGEHSALVFVTAEYGMKNDEGTMAALICRDNRHFMIGKRGGVKLLSLSANLKMSTPKNVRGVFQSVIYWHRKGDE
jgi:hypothetical protein